MDWKKKVQGWLIRVTPAEKMDHADRAALLISLEGSDRANRWRAAQELGVADPGREGLAALGAVLSSGDPILCWEAAHSLAHVGTPAAETALLEAVSAGSASAQAAAIDALGALPASPELLAALLGTLASDSATVRQSAAEAFARLAAQPAAEGVPSPGLETAVALLDLLQSDDSLLVRRAAALALGYLGDPVARDALEASQANGHEDPLVRRAAGEALGRLRRRQPVQEMALSDSSAEQPVEEEYHNE